MRIAPWVLAALALTGCSAGGVGPDPSDITGVWNANRIEYVGKAGQGAVERYAAGWRARLTLRTDQTGTFEMIPNGVPGWSWNGPWELDGDLLRLAGQGADVALSGGTLQIRGWDSAYDFDGDGAVDPAKLNIDAVR